MPAYVSISVSIVSKRNVSGPVAATPTFSCIFKKLIERNYFSFVKKNSFWGAFTNNLKYSLHKKGIFKQINVKTYIFHA